MVYRWQRCTEKGCVSSTKTNSYFLIVSVLVRSLHLSLQMRTVWFFSNVNFLTFDGFTTSLYIFCQTSISVKHVKKCYDTGICGMMGLTAAERWWSWINKAGLVNGGVCRFVSMCVCGETKVMCFSICLSDCGWLRMCDCTPVPFVRSEAQLNTDL